MPTYASAADVQLAISKSTLSDLTDDREEGQSLDPIINAAIERAEGKIHIAFKTGGYTVPIETPLAAGLEIVKAAAIWLAICDIFAGRPNMVPDDVKAQCEYYENLLKDIGSGESTPPAGEVTTSMVSSTTDQEKVFTRSKYDHDGEQLNEEEEGSLDVV